MTEGDVITIFSQYGEILDINLPRIPEGGLRDRNGDATSQEPGGSRSQQQQQQAGKPGDRRGFGFLLYEDQRSTVLAVDNLNGFVLLGRTIRVDHVKDYKMPGAKNREEEGELVGPSRNAAPALLEGSAASSDEDDEDQEQLDVADPMAAYIAASKKEKKLKEGREDKEERRRRKEERKRKREERERRRGDDSGSKKRRSEERGSEHRAGDKERIRERTSRDASYDRERPRYRPDDYHRDDRQRYYASRTYSGRDDHRDSPSTIARDDYSERRSRH